MSRSVVAEAIAVMRAEGLSDRRIATELGVSKSSIKAMAVRPAPADRDVAAQVEPLRRMVWVDVADTTDQHWLIEDDHLRSYERMLLHGITPELTSPTDLAVTDAREYVQVTTGRRILVYSQTRWNGRPNPASESGGDQRGRYLVEQCPGLDRGVCAAKHTPVALDEIGLDEGDDLYGDGWPQRRPTAHQVWKLITAAIEDTHQIFDPSYPEWEIKRRRGTTDRYLERADRRSARRVDAD
ncbi:helix-turn-helix domain-containing protein [Nocardia cyriacigeorgica]|uniref:helix-turn-helix domain-containing protein n=1 Tax=Nocardia cyriacigeorgica TaxID=135487 RepID=UPI0024581056|nr:helix-turn-helix domain-containing protein [Nocardia cyriacigeorgica]